MLAAILRRLGYLKVDYGFSCGRHWISIDGKVIAQTEGDHVSMFDEDVTTLGRAVIPGCTRHWSPPVRGRRSTVASFLDPYDPKDWEVER